MPSETPSHRRAVEPEDLTRIRTIADIHLSPDGRRVAYVLSAIDTGVDDYRTTIWVVAAEGDAAPVQVTRGPKKDSAPRWSPDGRTLAFLSDRDGDRPQLYVLPMDGGEARRLTDLPGGAGPAVWSPDSATIAFAARVWQEPPPEGDAEARKRWEQRPRPVTRAHYKDDGQGYTFDAVSQLFTVPATGGDVRQITSGDANSTQPVWSPDGARLAFVRNRTGAADYNLTDLWVGAADGAGATRLTDAIGRATLPAWSPDGTAIACLGAEEQRRAMGGEMTRLWSVPAAGGAPICVTSGYDRTPFVPLTGPAPAPVWSPDGASLTFLAADAGNVHIVRAAVAGGTVRAVVAGERQMMMAHMLPGGTLAFVASDPVTPGDVSVAAWDGSGERRLTGINDEVLAELDLPRAERRSFPGPDGGTLEGWLIRPPGVEGPAPLLVNIHGGPHGFHGNVFKVSGFFEYMLASRGWATLALNPTGSGSYGAAFMQGLLGRWGEFDLPEQLAAVDALVAEGIADPERLAVTGYSYGGYMTSWVVGHSDRFKAAVIGAPVTNLESFHGTSDIGIWFGEGEMQGGLVEARERYRRLSPVTYVDRVTTPCLILHGEADDRCPISQGEEFFAGLVARGQVPAAFVRYPGGSHLFVGNGRPSHRVDYMRRLAAWVERHVPPAGAGTSGAAATMAGPSAVSA